jgi:hypothetical protein
MADWDPEAWTRNLIADMRAHGGVPSSGPMAGETLLILTSTGAKSGEERRSSPPPRAGRTRTLPGTTTCWRPRT